MEALMASAQSSTVLVTILGFHGALGSGTGRVLARFARLCLLGVAAVEMIVRPQVITRLGMSLTQIMLSSRRGQHMARLLATCASFFELAAARIRLMVKQVDGIPL